MTRSGTWLPWVIAYALLASPIALRAQGTVLFSAYMTAATAPSYGHDIINTDQKDVRWTSAQRTGCGAGSGLNVDCWEWDETPNTGTFVGSPQGQHGLGFTDQMVPTRSYGDPALYWCTTFEYPLANTNTCCGNEDCSEHVICKHKLLSNPSAGTNCRSLIETGIQGDNAPGAQIQVDMLIQPAGGTTVGPDTGYTLSEGIVYDMCLRILGSSSAGVSDGRVDLWVVAHGTSWSEGSPTLTTGNIPLELGNAGCNSGNFNYGSQNNSWGLRPGRVHRINLYRQQLSTAFDTTWPTTWAGAGSSTTYSRRGRRFVQLLILPLFPQQVRATLRPFA